MAEATTLHDAFIDELRDTYDAEKTAHEGAPEAGQGGHVTRTAGGVRIAPRGNAGPNRSSRTGVRSLDEKVRGKHCDGIAGIIEEGKSIMEEDFDDATMDACLIAAGQRAEHYEMAAYGTLVAWAQAMGHDEAAELLQETLDEEKAADEKLSALAEGGINQEAARWRTRRRRGRRGARRRGIRRRNGPAPRRRRVAGRAGRTGRPRTAGCARRAAS